jgi:hypothetical protein
LSTAGACLLMAAGLQYLLTRGNRGENRAKPAEFRLPSWRHRDARRTPRGSYGKVLDPFFLGRHYGNCRIFHPGSRSNVWPWSADMTRLAYLQYTMKRSLPSFQSSRRTLHASGVPPVVSSEGPHPTWGAPQDRHDG